MPKQRYVFIFAAMCFAAALFGIVAAPQPSQSSVPSPSGNTQLTVTRAQPGDGSGQDVGVFLPPLAGPHGEIVGTVEDDNGPGASDFFIDVVDSNGSQHILKGSTDGSGRFHITTAQLGTGVVALRLFRRFDAQGHPDEGSTCQIGQEPVHLSGTRALADIPKSGPAILEAASAYERGGGINDQVALHTRDLDPSRASMLIDGSSADVDTVAASDQSIVATLSKNTPFGRHIISVDSAGLRSNGALAAVIATRFDPLPPMRSGEIDTVRLHVDGLGSDTAQVTFDVTGAADVADGGSEKVVPVKDGIAECPIRAVRPGQLIIHSNVEVDVPLLAEGIPSPVEHPSATATPSPRTTVSPGGVSLHVSLATSESPSPALIVPHVPEESEAPCHYTVSSGEFEPTQGAWQDDPFYRPKPLELLRYSSPSDTPRFDAPLPLVSNRRTLIYGVQHYLLSSGAEVSPDDRYFIEFRVRTNCTLMDQTYIHFEAFESLTHVWSMDTHPLDTIPLHGPPLPYMRNYSVGLNVAHGWPPAPSTLIFTHPGIYGIIADVRIVGGGDIGGRVYVTGRVVGTAGPTVHFVPIIVTKPHNAQDFIALRRQLRDAAQRLADAVGQYGPDNFPLAPGGKDGAGSMPALAEQPVDFSAAAIPKDPDGHTITLVKTNGAISGVLAPTDRLAAKLADFAQTREMIAGAGRIVAVLDQHDLGLISLSDEGSAFTYNGKLIVVSQSSNRWTTEHELVHTLPYDWVLDATRPPGDQWIVSWMLKECGQEYHNEFEPYPYGVDYLTIGQDLGHRNEFGEYTELIMGPQGDNKQFSLCDFNHLIHTLVTVPDPPVLLVRGFLSRVGGHDAAQFASLYTENATVDLKEGGPGTWAILVHDAHGDRRYPFEPFWRVPDLNRDLQVIALNHRVPEPTGAAVVQLLSPTGTVATVTLSASPPVLRIVSPSDGSTVQASNGSINVAWSATGATSRPLRASVFSSSDGGKNYRVQEFEIETNHAAVAVDAATPRQTVKVVVTDGTRSSEAVVHFMLVPR